MTSKLPWLLLLCAILLGTAAVTGWAQEKSATTSGEKFKILYINPRSKDAGPAAMSLIRGQASTGQTIAL